MPRAGMQQAEGEFTFVGGEGINRYLSPAKAGFYNFCFAVCRADGRS
jgi:hypothetical protein